MHNKSNSAILKYCKFKGVTTPHWTGVIESMFFGGFGHCTHRTCEQVRHVVFRPLESSHWGILCGVRCATGHVRFPYRNCIKRIMVGLLRGSINRLGGRPYSHSWHPIHLCTPLDVWETHSTHFYPLILHFGEIYWRASSAFASCPCILWH